jgi:hypothetical protein
MIKELHIDALAIDKMISLSQSCISQIFLLHIKKISKNFIKATNNLSR